jgi:ATP-dependent Clp protease ATP-binding subunit ClpA
LDQVVCFKELDQKAMQRIAGKHLEELTQRVLAYGVQLQLPEELGESLCGSIKKKDGARQLRRLVRDVVEAPLSSYLLRCSKKPAKLHLHMEAGELQFPK